MIGQWPSKLVMAKDIVCIFASFQMGSNKGAVKALGVDMRNVKKGCEQKLLLNTSSQAFWTNYRRPKRSNFLVAHFQQVMID